MALAPDQTTHAIVIGDSLAMAEEFDHRSSSTPEMAAPPFSFILDV
jgi:hypothetical protein